MGSTHDKLQSRTLDIGGFKLGESLLLMLKDRMLSPGKQCVLPSPLLSDDKGLDIWHKINRLPAYYQTNEEVRLLELHGSAIANEVPHGCALIDLGYG